MKTLWVRPKLIVLERSLPEEAVLTACKDINPHWTGTGPEDGYERCHIRPMPGPVCSTACHGSRSGS